MSNDKNTDKPVLATLREMAVGDAVTFPIERTSYLRSLCATFGAEWNKKFSTKTDRIERTVRVTRVQ